MFAINWSRFVLLDYLGKPLEGANWPATLCFQFLFSTTKEF